MVKKKNAGGKEQYVCTVCGYNMVDSFPEYCPFCGAGRDGFLTATEISRKFRVVETGVTDSVTMLRSQPALGYEHAAYRIDTGNHVCWIDCPSTFDDSLTAVDQIMYTHHHFLGAGNLYQKHFRATLAIHWKDSRHELCRGYTFDRQFDPDFTKDDIEAVHIDGHTPGFTLYRHNDVLFLCDYVFYNGQRAKFNPYGPVKPTRRGGARLDRFLGRRKIKYVCGFDYVADFAVWHEKFAELLADDVFSAGDRQ